MKLISLLLFIFLSFNSFAGHHGETKLSKENPEFDINDVFVFESDRPGHTTFILSFFSQKSKTKLAGENGLYKFHIATNKEFTKGITFVCQYNNDNIELYQVSKPIPELGEKGTLLGTAEIFKDNDLANGIRIWTGFANDPFQGNALGIRQFRTSAALNTDTGFFDIDAFDIGEEGNLFGKLTASIIVLEIPNEMIPDEFYYYASSTANIGNPSHWHQINRIANVLFPHTYLSTEEEKLKHVTGNPTNDESEFHMVSNVIEQYVKLSGYRKDPQKYADSIASLILPDIVHYRTGTKANYGLNERNGRHIRNDAMDVSLALMLGSDAPIDDGVMQERQGLTTAFPYVDYRSLKGEKYELIQLTFKDKKPNNSKTLYIIMIAFTVLFFIFMYKKIKSNS